ncbi:hypothetical protein CYMTET_52389 [Cymbomonas tetramitiformis]|uniref:Phytanoyl-CoA dioxygenase n=1 Tax=Cymbomonas tetramitiformis TaxID=36881 RepID=A0AAE0ER54_9CHLO|nr:hypothetical protein CYMTET_52389 [Cymbomonas tetramitiformis]
MKDTGNSSWWTEFNSEVLSVRPNVEDGLETAPENCPYPALEDIQRGQEELLGRYSLSEDQIQSFRQKRYVRLPDVIPQSVVSAVRYEIIKLVQPAFKGKNPSESGVVKPPAGTILKGAEAAQLWEQIAEPACKSWNLQMMWAVNKVIRQLVLAPRIGQIVSELFGCDKVRLYHDNTLSKVPGCPHTRWHCDDGPKGYMAMGSQNVVTVWIPLQRTTVRTGTLVFAEGINAWDVAAQEGCPGNEQSEEYDRFVAKHMEEQGIQPDVAGYEIGDISIHATDCFHMATPNHTTGVRMILASTYFQDGVAMREDKNLQAIDKAVLRDWSRFAPNVQPGQEIATKFNPVLPPVA